MPTPSTSTTDGSADRSTKVAQSVRLASGITAGRGSRKTVSGTVSTVAGAHVPILHLTALLPSPPGDVPKVLQGLTLEEQRNQATDIYKILNF